MGCVPFRKKDSKLNGIIGIKNLNNLSKKEETNTLKAVFSENIKIERGVFVQGFSGNPYEKYDLISQLGEGTYGRVLKVKEKDSNIFRAMKIIKKRSNYKNPEEEKRIKKEIHILRKLDHPNIIKVFEFYNHKSEFYIISELCEGGELFDRIIKLKKFTEKLAANVMKQILSAVQFCHKNQILHRDLKPENILIDTVGDSEDEEFFIIKVIDFGTADIFKNNSLLSKQIGTPYYIAPEVLNNQYNEKCDMWSCGVIMYILLSGCPPFYGKNDQEIYSSIKMGKYSFRQKIWESVTNEAKNLIKKLLELDFSKRPTAQEAIQDPWFTLYDDYETDFNQITTPTNNFNGKNSDNKSNEKFFLNNSKNNIKSDKDINQLYSNHNLNEISNKNDLNYAMLQNSSVNNDNNLNNNNKSPNRLNQKKSKKESLLNELGLREALFNLKNFRAERKLQLATLYFMVHTLVSKEDVKNIRDLFNILDLDKDGRLTIEEIKKGVKDVKFLVITEAEMQRIIDLIDIDGNGYIEYQEFIAATYDKKKILTEFNLRKAFDMFDKDKNGKISSDELKTVLGVGNEENEVVWMKIIREIDLDGDGEICFEEFNTMMYNLISSV